MVMYHPNWKYDLTWFLLLLEEEDFHTIGHYGLYTINCSVIFRIQVDFVQVPFILPFEFRSESHRKKYFAKCASAVSKWSKLGPQALNTEGYDVDGSPFKDPPKNGYTSGLWLFTDRTKITHFFPPNFLPPYNTPDKLTIIQHFLKEEWDEKTLSWKPTSINLK